MSYQPKCICHHDWPDDGCHRVPIDCNTLSKAETEVYLMKRKDEIRAERKARLSRHYDSWEDEFDDKIGSLKEVGGWVDYDDIDIVEVKAFIKRLLK